MQCNGNFRQWFNIFLIISEAWQGYESKAYGVSNHNLKLQSKKLSRTRDIPNFPTQGWAGTAFCTRKRSETCYFHDFSLIWNWKQTGWNCFSMCVLIISEQQHSSNSLLRETAGATLMRFCLAEEAWLIFIIYWWCALLRTYTSIIVITPLSFRTWNTHL